MVLVLAFLLYWLAQNWQLLIDVFAMLGWAKFFVLLGGLQLVFVLAVFAFVVLTRTVQPRFTFADGYNAFNFAQVASVLPGGIWGIAGLAGWLWSRNISKADSAVIVSLNLFFSFAACALFGVIALGATFGAPFMALGFLPLVFWLLVRRHLDSLRQKFFPALTALPNFKTSGGVIGLSLLVWAIEAACFTWLVFDVQGKVELSPFLIASAYSAAYLVGLVVLIAPSGLGVREGVLVALLGNSIGADQVLALALTFRLAQTVVQWLNVFVSWLMRFGIRDDLVR